MDTSRIPKRGNVKHIDKTESDSEYEEHDQSGGDSDAKSDDGSEYEEYDLTNNPLYQVLSAFLEDDEGNNLCDHIQKLTSAVTENSTKLDKLLRSKERPSSASTKKRSSKK